jgi:hypothetical protein
VVPFEAMQQSSAKVPSRVSIVVLIFVLACLLSTARLIIESPVSRLHAPDEISQRSDLRFAELKALLPEHGVVGYIGDSNDATADYYLAQYALAPLVVEHSLNHPLIVGNFPALPQSTGHNLRIIRDFGNGVLLLAPKDEK